MAKIVSKVKGLMTAVSGDNIDTDRIIPARFLKTVDFSSLGQSLFYDERFDENAGEKAHPLNRHPEAKILLVDRNFGCGSSREHAAHALKDFGIEAIVGISFGDIFRNNCRNLGIPCATISTEKHAILHRELINSVVVDIVIDIEEGNLRFYEESITLQIPDSDRQAFLSGSYDCFDELIANWSLIEALDRCLPPSPIPNI